MDNSENKPHLWRLHLRETVGVDLLRSPETSSSTFLRTSIGGRGRCRKDWDRAAEKFLIWPLAFLFGLPKGVDLVLDQSKDDGGCLKHLDLKMVNILCKIGIDIRIKEPKACILKDSIYILEIETYTWRNQDLVLKKLKFIFKEIENCANNEVTEAENRSILEPRGYWREIRDSWLSDSHKNNLILLSLSESKYFSSWTIVEMFIFLDFFHKIESQSTSINVKSLIRWNFR